MAPHHAAGSPLAGTVGAGATRSSPEQVSELSGKNFVAYQGTRSDQWQQVSQSVNYGVRVCQEILLSEARTPSPASELIFVEPLTSASSSDQWVAPRTSEVLSPIEGGYEDKEQTESAPSEVNGLQLRWGLSVALSFLTWPRCRRDRRKLIDILASSAAVGVHPA